MKLALKICLGLSLLSVFAGIRAMPSPADEVIWKSTTTQTPNRIGSPASTLTTTVRTIESNPTGSLVLTPDPDTTDETYSRSTTVLQQRPASISSTTSISSRLDSHPNYGARIQLLRQQLDKGIANGWIKTDQASQLSTRLNDIQNQEAQTRAAGYLKVDLDSLEKALTGFNIDLSHSMEEHSM